MDDRAAVRTIATAIKRRLYLLVAIVAACTLIAGLAAIIRPPVYQGTALLFVDQRFNSSQGFDISLQAGGPLSDHFIQTSTSLPVLVRACSRTYFDTPALSGFSCTATSLMPRVSANTVSSQDWIAVNVTAGSAAEAAALATAVARAMVDYNQADIDKLLTPTKNYLDAELKRLGGDVQTEQATIAQLQTAPGHQDATASHQANLNLLQSQYLSTYARIQDLVIEENRLAGSLKLDQPAVPPLNPVDPDPVRYLAVGLVAGMCVALLAVALVDRFDDRLFDTEALSMATGTRLVLAVTSRDSATLSRRASNPYAMARTNLLALHPDLTKVLVVAASSRDLVRPVGAGLGTAAVKAGQKVLLVDPDASTYVMQQQSGHDGPRMTILSAPADGETLDVSGAPTDADGTYDLTIILTPPPETYPSAISMARVGDIAIVVATAGATRFSDVKRTTETLRLAGIRVDASILAVDSVRKVRGSQELPTTGSETGTATGPELKEMAANQPGLPIWRGAIALLKHINS
jgi:uncharacterized protein involved in exopolysaccharide biosynthesis